MMDNGILAWLARLGRGRAPVTVRPGAWLRTRYLDGEVVAMAQEDGDLGILRPSAGAGSRVLAGELAVWEAPITGALGVRHRLDGSLGKIRSKHAHVVQAFRPAKARAREELVGLLGANAQQESLRRRLAGMGLEQPAPRWAEAVFLCVLGIGDLTMTSVSFMVLNISDRPFVAWLPFSALTLAAIPVVGGMLGAAHFLGESIRAYRHEPGRRMVIIGAASLAGGLVLALSVAAIRSAFLAANGVPPLSLPFIGIQLGLFAVAAAASAWAAHPLQAQWRAVARAVRRARRGYRAARRRAGRLAGRVNRQAARQLTAISKAASAAQALLSDGKRQRYLYRRGYALVSAPESANDLWAPLAPPELPREVLALLKHPDHTSTGSNLDPLESVTLDDLDATWERLQGQAQDEVDAARRGGDERRRAPAGTASRYPLNGVSRELRSIREPASGGGES